MAGRERKREEKEKRRESYEGWGEGCSLMLGLTTGSRFICWTRDFKREREVR